MRNFHRDDRGGSKFGGRDSGGRGGNRFGGRDSGGRDFGKPSMFEARCDECGKHCEVPFKPSGDRPIFCSSCFQSKGDNDRGGDRRESRDRSDRFGGREERPRFEEKRMFSATCSSCGCRCEVPFRPTEGKDVFCDDCFGKKDSFGTGNKGNIDVEALKEEIKLEMKEQFDILNAKLDKILRKFAPVVSAKDLPLSAVAAEPDEDDEESIVVKKKARKAAAKKEK